MSGDSRSKDRECTVTPAMEDYLKVIYKLQIDPAAEAVTTSLLAQRMGVSAPSATSMVKRLSELRLVEHVLYHGVELTTAGHKIALETIRHHRLLEAYLANVLGFSWDLVDAEAERLEHVISEAFEDRIDEVLGYPTTDPHGHPIPDRSGALDPTPHVRLTEAPAGARVTIRRVSDRDPEMLRYLDSLGLRPGVEVRLLERAPFEGPLLVQIGPDAEHHLGREVAATIQVVSVDDVPLADGRSSAAQSCDQEPSQSEMER